MTREEIHKLPWKAQEYINELERKLTLNDVGVPKGTLCDFEHHNADIRQARWCSECGEKN